MQYLTLEQYNQLGGKYEIETLLFTRLEFKARMSVDQATFKRLTQVEVLPELLTMLMVELIDYYYNATKDGNIITSKSNSQGGVSQSENYLIDASDNQAYDMINSYLVNLIIDNVPVLYRGAGCG